MKNETTYKIELEKLQSLFQLRKFDEGEQLATRMLKDYNHFDCDLLLQRARIRQCLMKYEEALADANLALQVQPKNLAASHQLSDCLIATQRFPEAVKLLQVLIQSEPANQMLKNQYEMLKAQTVTQQVDTDDRKSEEMASLMRKVRESAEIASSSPDNYEKLRMFIKEERVRITNSINRQDAEEKKITESEACLRRDKMIAHNKRKLADDAMIMLSDEQSVSEEEEMALPDDNARAPDAASSERPNSAAQFQESGSASTSSGSKQMDFRNINSEELFGKRREVYRLKAQKLEGLVDCQLCKLIFDYTKTCNHFTMETDLKAEQLKQFARQSQSEKLKALAKITRSLDILSTARISSFMLKKQIAELLSMYLQKSANVVLSPHFKDFQMVSCEKCGLPSDETQPTFDPTILALKILNRCFTFQIESMILNQTEDLLEQVVSENQREVTIREFAAETDYTIAVSERLQDELLQIKTAGVKDETKINFELLYQLVRAMCNILILTADQAPLVRSLHGQKKHLSSNLVFVLNKMPTDLLSQEKADASKVLTKNQIRNFVLFVTHSLRLLIISQSIDKNCLETEENPQLKTSLQQMLRKYALFEIAFPLSKRLMDSLKGDVLWYSHATQEGYCKLTAFYENEESKYQTCGNCQKVDTGLKVCSRCRKAYYCDQICQKAHYPTHKQNCIVKTLEMLTAAATVMGSGKTGKATATSAQGEEVEEDTGADTQSAAAVMPEQQ